MCPFAFILGLFSTSQYLILIVGGVLLKIIKNGQTIFQANLYAYFIVCRMGGTSTSPALPCGIYRLQTYTSPALHIPGRWWRASSGCWRTGKLQGRKLQYCYELSFKCWWCIQRLVVYPFIFSSKQIKHLYIWFIFIVFK